MESNTVSKGFLHPYDLATLRRRAATPPFDRLWRRLRERTHCVAQHALATEFAGFHGNIGWHSHTPMLPVAALLSAVEDDAAMQEYFDRALAFIDGQSRERLACNVNRAIHSHAEIAIAADVLRDELLAPTRDRLLAFMREVAIDDNDGDSYLMNCGGSNIRWARNVQAAVCALLWGEECGHPQWQRVVQQGIDHTRCYLRYGCDAGGFSYEGTGYGHSVFAVMFPFVELLYLTGYADLYQSEPRLHKIAEAAALSIFPDNSFPINDNDVGLRGAESLPYLLLLAKRTGDAEARGLWEAYQGPEHPIRPYGDMWPWIMRVTGREDVPVDPLHSLFFTFLYWEPEQAAPPRTASTLPLAIYSPGTETVNLRTSWGRDAIYVNVQGAGRSHASLTHRHADAGHFSIFAHGEYLAIDTGRYNSDEDQHSVMLVDGKPHCPIAPRWGMEFTAGRVSRYQSNTLLTHLRIDAAQMKGCHWADRDLLWVPLGNDDAYLVVLDNLNKDNAEHAFWWQLQAHPDTRIEIDSDWQARVMGERARLDLSFLWPGPEDFPDAPHRFALRQDVKEWHNPYGEKRDLKQAHAEEGLLNTSFARPRLVGELNGLNGQLLTVVVPRRAGAPPLTVRRRQQKRLLWLEIETPLGTDTIIAAPDHGFIRTEEYSGLSELFFLRRDMAGNRIADWSLGEITNPIR